MTDLTVIEERLVAGRRLGRHVEHDPRSLAYRVHGAGVEVTSVEWERKIPVLDQLDLGSCTGNAAVGLLGTEPFPETLPDTVTLDEALAVALYGLATTLDEFDGAYPPYDTGSSGLAVAKAAQGDGLVVGYQHATSLQAALAALMVGPVLTGVNWYADFDYPNGDGVVYVGGPIRGGHEVVVTGVDIDAQEVIAWNSWGPNWGLGGKFRFTFADWARLLSEDGDVTTFVPINEPAPQPEPIPTPQPEPTPVGWPVEGEPVNDEQLLTVARAWKES